MITHRRILIILVISLLVTSIAAQDTEDGVLFETSFDDSELPEEMRVIFGESTIEDGILTVTTDEQAFVPILSGAEWTDYAVEVRMKIVSGRVWLQGRTGEDTCSGYYFALETEQNAVNLASANTECEFEILETVDYEIPLDTWLDIRIDLIGESIYTSINNDTIFLIDDSEHTQGLPIINIFAVGGQEAEIQIDFIEITAPAELSDFQMTATVFVRDVTATVEAEMTQTAEAVDVAQATDEPAETNTPTEEPSSTATDTPEPSNTPTEEPSATATNTPTDIPTATATNTPEATNTPVPSDTPTHTPEPTASPTEDLPTLAVLPSITPLPTLASLPTETPTDSPTLPPLESAFAPADAVERLASDLSDSEQTISELEAAGMIPAEGELVFEDDLLRIARFGSWYEPLTDEGWRNIVVSGELAIFAANPQTTELCQFSLRAETDDSGLVVGALDVGIASSGSIYVRDLLVTGEAPLVEVRDAQFLPRESVQLVIVALDNTLTVYADGELLFEELEIMGRTGITGVTLESSSSATTCLAANVWGYGWE